MLYGRAVVHTAGSVICIYVSLTNTETSDKGQAPPYRQTWRSTTMSEIVSSETQNTTLSPKGAQSPDDQLQSNSHRLSLSESPYTTFRGQIWHVYCVHLTFEESSWNVMAHGDAREGKWRGNWRMEWAASTFHAISEHGLSSIIAADAHTSAASSRLNWRPRRFKWTRPFRRKTKSGFCACAIPFQTQSTASQNGPPKLNCKASSISAFDKWKFTEINLPISAHPYLPVCRKKPKGGWTDSRKSWRWNVLRKFVEQLWLSSTQDSYSHFSRKLHTVHFCVRPAHSTGSHVSLPRQHAGDFNEAQTALFKDPVRTAQ